MNVHSTAISVGDLKHLENVLRNAGIADPEVKQLSEAIQSDGNEKMKERGNVMGWIKGAAPRVLVGGVKMGVSVGQAVLIEWIKQYYGLN